MIASDNFNFTISITLAFVRVFAVSAWAVFSSADLVLFIFKSRSFLNSPHGFHKPLLLQIIKKTCCFLHSLICIFILTDWSITTSFCSLIRVASMYLLVNTSLRAFKSLSLILLDRTTVVINFREKLLAFV